MNRRWFLQLLGLFPILRWLLKTPRSPEVVVDTMPDRGAPLHLWRNGVIGGSDLVQPDPAKAPRLIRGSNRGEATNGYAAEFAIELRKASERVEVFGPTLYKRKP
jgi:hypothetical protein